MLRAVAFLMLTTTVACSAPEDSPLPPERGDGSRGASAGLCGDPRLEGTRIDPVSGKLPRCGIQAPVRITAVNGIALSTPARLDCQTATTFADWLTDAAVPGIAGKMGTSIEKVWVMASYSCRARNNQPGAKLSEHSFGHAIDIGGFWLQDGRRITVKDNWGKGQAGSVLRDLWRKACGPFKTVLGPDSDRWHQDHFHFDTARRRNAYCR